MPTPVSTATAEPSYLSTLLGIARPFLFLGVTSFGGPVAHLAYFRGEFVEKRRWLSELTFAEFVALCQLLPGPASSQVAFLIGKNRGGMPGAIVAAVCFSLPSVLLMIAVAMGVMTITSAWLTPVLTGLKLAAVVVVAQAVWTMGKVLCPDRERLSLCLIAAAGVLMTDHRLGPIVAIVAGGVAGLFLLRKLGIPTVSYVDKANPGDRFRGLVMLGVFFALLMALPLLARLNPTLALVDALYRSGAMVFGGGHVVLPMLQNEPAITGLMSDKTFLAGYGAAQAMPGPLFSFSAFVGAMSAKGLWSIPAGLAAAIALFLPGFLLVAGVEPFWNRIKFSPRVRHIIAGANAAVVGVLLAALYHPLITTAITSSKDVAVVLFAFAALVVWRIPVWAVVLGIVGWEVVLASAK